MKPVSCPREQAVARAVLSRRFEVSEELRSHAETCELCAGVVSLAAAFRDERNDALRDVRVPAAGQIWWRAALRAHAEATASARRPMVWLQGIAGACALGVCAALLSLAWPSIYDVAVVVAALPATLGPDVAPFVDALRPAMPLALAAVACLVVTPIVVYFALSDD